MKKSLLLSVAIWGLFAFNDASASLPTNVNELTQTTLGSDSAYNLVVGDSGNFIITKYWDDAGTVTAQKLSVVFNNPLGDTLAAGDPNPVTKYFKWQDSFGAMLLVESNISDYDIIAKASSNEAIRNSSNLGDLNRSFVSAKWISAFSESDSRALSNSGTIESITGDFVDNATSPDQESGGAIQNSLKIGSITGSFIGNASNVHGGAIYNVDTINSIKGDFIDNTGTEHGGAIYNERDADIIDITGSFIKNYTRSDNADGGAIDNNGNINTIDADFIGNFALGTSLESPDGGAIDNTALINLIQGSFVGNYTESLSGTATGGAIYNARDDSGSSFGGQIRVIDADFIRNGIDSNGLVKTALGGAIYNERLIESVAGDFIGNAAKKSGGAIYQDSPIAIQIISNPYDGSRSTFKNNYVANTSGSAEGSKGGAIYIYEGAIDIEDTDFIDNYASGTSSDMGGAIYINNSAYLRTTNSTFSNNANNSSNYYTDFGGAIYNAAGGYVTIIDTQFTDNAAAVEGGAIYNEAGGEIDIESLNDVVEFSGNTAGALGSETSNAIHNLGIINLEGGKSIVFNDAISGGTGTININGGNVTFNEDIYNNVFLNKGTLFMGVKETTYTDGHQGGITISSLTANSSDANINSLDGKVTDYYIDSLNVQNSQFSIDMDLTNLTADRYNITGSTDVSTNMMLINLVSIPATNVSGRIEVFNNNGAGVTGDITLPNSQKVDIVSFDEQITLNHDTVDDGWYYFDVDISASTTLNRAISQIDLSTNTTYNMLKTNTSSLNLEYFYDNGNEYIESQSVVSAQTAGGTDYVGKIMNVNGLNGTGGFTVSGKDGADVLLTLVDGSQYNSFNVNYDNVNFDMTAASNKVTFNMAEDVTSLTLDSNFSSDIQANVVELNGNPVANSAYTLDGTIDNLTLDVNATTTATGDITDAIVNVNSTLSTTGAVDGSTINVDSRYNGSGEITNSEVYVNANSYFESSANITDTYIDTSSNVYRSAYDDGVRYKLNTDAELSYNSLDNLYNGAQTTLNSIDFNGGTLAGFDDGAINTIRLETLTLSSNSTLNDLDVELAIPEMDSINGANFAGSATLNVGQLNLLSDSALEETYVDFADDNLKNSVAYTGAGTMVGVAPVYIYDVSYLTSTGQFLFSRGEKPTENPQVQAPAVGALAAILITEEIYSKVLADSSIIPTLNNLSSGDYTLDRSFKNAWIKTFGSDENLDVKNARDVDIDFSGVIAGADTGLIYEGNCIYANYGLYAAYTDSYLEHHGNKFYQDGYHIGAHANFYKDNWFAGATTSVGMVRSKDKNSSSAKFNSYFAGVGLKAGYVYEMNDDYELTSSLFASYIYADANKYVSAMGASVDFRGSHNFVISPELKLSKEIDEGTKAYLKSAYVHNFNEGQRVIANGFELKEVGIRPYVEYGVGFEKLIGKWTGFAEVLRKDFGSEGFEALIGLKYHFD